LSPAGAALDAAVAAEDDRRFLRAVEQVAVLQELVGLVSDEDGAGKLRALAFVDAEAVHQPQNRTLSSPATRKSGARQGRREQQHRGRRMRCSEELPQHVATGVASVLARAYLKHRRSLRIPAAAGDDPAA
jgi:hypothetical protein